MPLKKKITDLPVATPLTGAEDIYVVQSGVSKQATIGDINTFLDIASAILLGRKPRVLSFPSAATVTIDCSTTDHYELSALAIDVVFNAPTNLYDGKMILVRLVDNGTSRNITLNSIFVDISGNMPGATTIGKATIFGARYSLARTKFEILSAITEA